MKISDFKEVEKVIGILNKIDVAINQCNEFHKNQIEEGKDSGGIENIADFGYYSHVATYKDGSGKKIELSGCYVGHEIANEIEAILKKKKTALIEWLKSKGVQV